MAVRTGLSTAAETGPVKIRLSRTRPSSTENVPTDSLLALMRTFGLGSVRLKIFVFTFLSLIGGLSQALLLVLISEVAVANVEGKKAIQVHGHSIPPNDAIVICLLALALFVATSILGALVSTSVSAQVLAATRTRVVTGFFRAKWALQSTERLGHLQQLLIQNSAASAAVVANLSGGLQASLMVAGLLGVALAVNPAAAIAVIAMGIVLSQILRPLNQRTRRNNRQLSKATRAMATQVTEFTRLSRDFRLFGVESRVIDG